MSTTQQPLAGPPRRTAGAVEAASTSSELGVTRDAGTASAVGGRAAEVQTLLGRYRVEATPFASGGQGAVYRGRDLPTGLPIVVKRLFPGQIHAELVRRETAALRGLRIPGVARLRADGEDERGCFLVMDYVEGLPFPGVRGRLTWEQLVRPLRGLLVVIGRVHAAGFVHADLKPNNVLVSPQGDITLLDFGIAAGRALPPPPSGLRGTLGFMAPELRRGTPPEIAADLYAVGVMIGLSLCGSAFLDHSRADWVPAPAPVQGLLHQLLLADPGARPRGVHAIVEVLDALDAHDAGASSTDVHLPPGGPLTEPELRALFAGPEPFLHLPSEGARIVLAATAGERGPTERLLRRWLRDGEAYIVGGQLHLNSLERLAPHPEERAFDRLLRQDDRSGRLPEEALRTATRWADEGRPQRGAALLDRALNHLQGRGRWAEARSLLPLRTVLALSMEDAESSNQALAALLRDPGERAALQPLEELLRGMEAHSAGLFEELDLALQRLSPFADEELETWRQVLRLRAAQRRGPAAHAALLDELGQGWARAGAPRARWLGWRGNAAYTSGAYRDAAALHRASLEGRRTLDSRLSALRNLAAALLEVPELEETRTVAGDLQREARACGHAHYEAHAVLLERKARYRLEQPVAPDEDLVEAAARLDPRLEGSFGCLEATFAWRAGEGEAASHLALRAERAFLSTARQDFALLCRSLATAIRGAPLDELSRMAEQARQCRSPEIHMQILALCRLSTEHPDPAWTTEARRIGASLPLARQAIRLDILSTHEASDPAWPPPARSHCSAI